MCDSVWVLSHIYRISIMKCTKYDGTEDLDMKSTAFQCDSLEVQGANQKSPLGHSSPHMQGQMR